MRNRRKIGWGIFVVAVVATTSTLAWMQLREKPGDKWRSLAEADQYQLLSLQPDLLSRPDFHNREVLGQTEITDAETRERLSTALRSVASVGNGRVPTCFNPRHAIHVTHAGVATDFVICFECRQVEVWRDGKEITFLLANDSPQAVFDEVLRKNNVPLATK